MGLKFNPTTGNLDIVNTVKSAITTEGDLIVGDSNAFESRLPIGANETVLTSNGTTATWEAPSGSGGDVVGPSSARDNYLAIFNTTTGKLLKDSGNAFISGGILHANDSTYTSTTIIGTTETINGDESVSIGDRSFCGTNSVSIGENARTTTDGVAIGRSANCQADDSVSIGMNSNSSAIRSVSIGHTSRCSQVGVAVGWSSRCSGQTGVALGYLSSATATGAISIGGAVGSLYGIGIGSGVSITQNYGLAIGRNATVSHTSSASIGYDSSTTGSNQMVLGGSNQFFNNFFFGVNEDGLSETTLAGQGPTSFNVPNVSSGITNGAAQGLVWRAGAGTGTGAGGDFSIEVAPAGSSGTTRNSFVEVVKFSNTGSADFQRAVSKKIETVSTDTILDHSQYTVLVDTSLGDIDITLPSTTTGRIYNIKKKTSDSNKVNIIGTVDGGTSTKLNVQYESLTVQYDGISWWIL